MSAVKLHVEKQFTLAKECETMQEVHAAVIQHTALHKQMERHGMKPPRQKGRPLKPADDGKKGIVKTVKLL